MNTETRFDVVAIGNAIVDVLTNKEDNFFEEHNMQKGVMTLIDAERAEALYEELAKDNLVQCSGGSAANTAVGIAKMGGKPAFIGKVACDKLGDVFRDDITAVGVDFSTPCLLNEKPTARCIVLVSPDAQRTMNTFLGACARLSRSDIDEDLIRTSKITYIEGYLWDRDESKDAITYAVELARKYNRKVSLSLSDPFCVNRHRDTFMDLIKKGVDILFCNEEEIKALFNTEDAELAFEKCKTLCELCVITRGADGAVAINGEKRFEIPAEPIDKVVDTTGAGDSFAAGFLTGYSQNRSIKDCIKMGAVSAAEMISHYGARPVADLIQLIKEKVG